ncbi:hypothetical protein FRB93_013231 [Tulasnella sp. JGI-2019a]|nr:hypothetical protein FRB93_013231 [Tulasnella sp. JGI-2019a]
MAGYTRINQLVPKVTMLTGDILAQRTGIKPAIADQLIEYAVQDVKILNKKHH